jgi:phage-related protein
MSAYRLEFYADPQGREPVVDWLDELTPHKRRAAVAALECILARDGVGICGTSWGKWVRGVEGGIFELRIRHDHGTIMRSAGLRVPDEDRNERDKDVLLRVFCHAYGKRVVLLLAAYDKGKQSNRRRQAKEARIASKRLADWKRRGKAST